MIASCDSTAAADLADDGVLRPVVLAELAASAVGCVETLAVLLNSVRGVATESDFEALLLPACRRALLLPHFPSLAVLIPFVSTVAPSVLHPSGVMLSALVTDTIRSMRPRALVAVLESVACPDAVLALPAVRDNVAAILSFAADCDEDAAAARVLAAKLAPATYRASISSAISSWMPSFIREPRASLPVPTLYGPSFHGVLVRGPAARDDAVFASIRLKVDAHAGRPLQDFTPLIAVVDLRSAGCTSPQALAKYAAEVLPRGKRSGPHMVEHGSIPFFVAAEDASALSLVIGPSRAVTQIDATDVPQFLAIR
ncbi:hypothetical protein HK405_015627, partial [Cladochytrium tenue]